MKKWLEDASLTSWSCFFSEFYLSNNRGVLLGMAPSALVDGFSPFVRFFSFFFFRCVRISIRGLVRRSVGPLVGPSVMLSSKSLKNGLIRILNALDSAGQGEKRDEEEGVTRRKERGLDRKKKS